MAQLVNTTVSSKVDSVTLGANNDFIIIDVEHWSAFGIQIAAGLTGTVTFTGTIDGTNFFSITGTNQTSATSASNEVNPSNAYRQFDTSALMRVRIQITAYGSGSCVVSWLAEDQPSANGLVNVGFIAPGLTASALGKAEDNPHTSGDTGVAVWGVRNDSRAGTTNTSGDYTQVSADGAGAVHTVIMAQRQDGGVTAGTLTGQFHQVSGASTNATSIKAAVGFIYGWTLTNSTASVKYVKLYNKASAPTVGTDTPILTIGIPANGTVSEFLTVPIGCGTGIAYATTGALADTDATALAANDIVANIFYI